jgi:hypothetical protein
VVAQGRAYLADAEVVKPQPTGEPPRVRVRVARGSFPRLLWLTVGQVNPGLKIEIVSGRGGNTLGDRNGHP